jgi:hypothetical protein
LKVLPFGNPLRRTSSSLSISFSSCATVRDQSQITRNESAYHNQRPLDTENRIAREPFVTFRIQGGD